MGILPHESFHDDHSFRKLHQLPQSCLSWNALFPLQSVHELDERCPFFHGEAKDDGSDANPEHLFEGPGGLAAVEFFCAEVGHIAGLFPFA